MSILQTFIIFSQQPFSILYKNNFLPATNAYICGSKLNWNDRFVSNFYKKDLVGMRISPYILRNAVSKKPKQQQF